MMLMASNYTRFAAGGSADQAVESEGTIIVYGIVCANTTSSAETVLIEESDGSTIIQTIQVPANATVVHNIPFLADNGVNVTPGANTSVTVYHSKSGA